MNNAFTDYLEQLQARDAAPADVPKAVPAPAAPEPAIGGDANEYLESLSQRQRIEDDTLNAFARAHKANPDEWAKMLQKGEAAGLSREVMEQFPAEAERRARYDEAAKLVRESPKTAQWLARPDNAELAKDDTGPLADMERILAETIARVAAGGPIRKQYEFETQTKGALQAGMDRMGKGSAGLGAAAGESLSEYVTGPLTRNRILPEDIGARIGAFYREQAKGWEAKAKKDRGDLSKFPWLGKAVLQGVESMPGSAGAAVVGVMTRNPGLAAMFMAAPVGGEGYVDAREKGRGIAQSLSHGSSQAIIEYVTEFIPAAKMLQDLGLQKTFLTTLRNNLAREIPGEQAATILQDLNDWATLNPDKPFADYIKARPGAAAETLVATIVATGGQIAVGRIADDTLRGNRGQADQAFMQSIGDAATASKLRERMPAKYRELVDEIAKGGPVENIRIPAETFATYFQGAGMDPAAVAQEVGARNFDAAMAAHTDIIIPVGDYAAKIAATEHHAALMPDIRLRDGDLTAREYEAYKADRAEMDARMAEEAGQEAGGEKKDALSIIEAHFRDQLLALGRSPAVADAYATAQARPIMRMAEESGVDPMAIIEKYGLTVTSPLPDVLTKKGTTEASIDALLERLRTGDIPQDEAIYGQRLTDFLRKSGGIKDTQGELKGRDLDKNLKPGQSRLVRDDGLDFDAALTAARQAGYLPESPADRPDETGINDLLDALLQDEQAGVFSSKSTNDELLQLRGMLESLGGYLDSLGIDLTQIADNAQVRELMKQAGEVVGEMADGYKLAQSMDGGTVVSVTPSVEIMNEKEWIRFPVEAVSTGIPSDSPEIRFLGGGRIQYVQAFDFGWPNAYSLGVMVRDALQKEFEKSVDFGDGFWRFTYNKKEPELAKKGELRNSLNHHENFLEPGVSVAENPAYGAAGYPYGYRVTGAVVGYGSDGEPALDASTIKVIGKIQKTDDIDKKYFALLEKAKVIVFKKYGLTEQSYRGVAGINGSPVLLKTQDYLKDSRVSVANTGTFSGETGNVLFQSGLQDGTVALNALADKGNNQAIVAKSFVNSAGLGTEQFSYVFEGASSGAQPDGFVGVPSLAAMLSHMRTAVLNDAKVLDAVVGSVPVDMVNNLFGSEQAAKMVLHDEAMLKDSPAFNADLPVSGALGDATNPVGLLVREVARRTAELISGTIGPGRPSGKVIAASETGVFSQDTSSKKRAFITIGSNRKISISLLQNADLSSFLHETGHAYLEIMGDLAESDGASEQLKADWAKTLKFLKVATRAEIGVEQHEMWARANEAYLMEGNAPSAELRGVFQKFKSWLKLIYKQIEALNVKLTPEVRGVFDRLYASEAEIESAKKEAETRPLFLDAAAAGMTEAEFALYTKAIADGTETAKENLESRLMREQQRETQKWWKEARDKIKAEVTAEVEATPVYRAFAALSSGQMPDETPIRLSRDDLVRRYGEAWLKKLPRGFGYLYAKEGGADIQTAAEMLGFSDADALVNALADMRPKKELIEAETEARMRDTYGDTLNDAEAMRQAAVSALHNDRQAEVLALELRALRKKRLEVAPFVRQERARAQDEKQAARAVVDAIPPLSAFRDAAAGMISQMQARDIRPGDYLRASQKANKQAFKAMAKDDHQAAYEAKRRELLNHYLYREALAAREEVESILDKARSFEKPSTRKRIGLAGADYLEQIDGILERYEFKRVTLRAMDRRTSLALWAEKMEAEGHAVNVDTELLDDSKIVNFREASMDTLRAVRDALVNIEHLAGLKNKLLKKKGAVEWEAVENELLGALAANTKIIGTLGEINRFGETIKDKGARLWRRFDAAHMKVEQIVEWMDGGKIDGPWARYFFDLADDAQSREYDLHKEITKRLQDLSESMPKEWRNGMIERVPGFSLPGISASQTTRATLISIALNAGNTSSIDKMLRGHNWTPEQLDLALKQMGEADWRFVQGVWDTLETLWPEIAALEKRVSGVEPPRVDAREIETEWGAMRGGYYPLVYDPKRSSAGEKQADATESVQDFMARGYGRASTSKGHTKARLDEFAAPLRLDYEQVLSSHLSKVIKDISHREAVLGLNKILKSRAIKPELIDRLGEEKYTLLNEWVQTLVSDRADTLHQSLSLHHALFRGLRTNTAIVTMGWKISTMMSQFAGFGPSVDLVGYRNMTKALGEFYRHPGQTIDLVFEKSGEMRHRTNTIERDMKEQLLKLRGKSGLLAATQRTAFYLTAMADRMVSVPTWIAGYRKALAEGMGEDDAVRAGDRAVRLSQGAGGAKDLAAVQRQSELMKLLTMYYTPFSVLYARLRDVGQTTNSVRDLPRLVARSIALVILPAVLGDLLAGRGPDDDEDEIWYAARKAVLYPTASVPILRDLVQWQLEPALVELTGGTMHYQPRYQFSPILSAVQKIASIPDKTLDAMTGDREWDEVAWDVFEASGYVFGLPTAQPRITGEYLTDLMGGDANPESIGEALHDLAFRRPRQ